MTYDDYWPLIQQAMEQGRGPLLYEDPAAWAITRGNHQGHAPNTSP